MHLLLDDLLCTYDPSIADEPTLHLDEMPLLRPLTTVKPGQILGKCRLIRQAGVGSSGVVFKAWHLALNIPVAVKVLHETNGEFVQRFRTEACVLAQFCHPHVVRVWDFDDNATLPYLVMEYVDGSNLGELLRHRGRLPLDQAVPILLQIAGALEATQKLGIVHCDVKPGNILLDQDGTAKLADLGLAALAGHQFGNGSGTAAYMPPEQALGGRIDYRSDIYALGATFYHLITGSLPFPAVSYEDMIREHRLRPVPSPRSLVPHLPPLTASIIARMMAKSPADRYQSYETLRYDLAQLTDSNHTITTTRSFYADVPLICNEKRS